MADEPKAPAPAKEKRMKVSRSQAKIYQQLQADQTATRNALTNFVLGVLAGGGVEGFVTANLDIEKCELVYIELPKP